MKRNKLFEHFRREKNSAISPVIATLLLILIAIAAGVVVYAYVIGFIGNSTSNSGATTSVIQITNFCASTTTHCNGADVYYISVMNTGSVSISAGTVQLYFTDVTSSTVGSFTATCSISATSPGSAYTCTPSTPGSWTSSTSATTAPSAGDTLTLKVVNPDGGSATSSTKVIA